MGSGAAGSACRHVAVDRMERTGVRWTVPGAQSMPHLRAIYLNGGCEDYLNGYLTHYSQTDKPTIRAIHAIRQSCGIAGCEV